MAGRLLGAAVLLCLLDIAHTFAIEEQADVFKRTACPAFLAFDNAAYLADMTFELPCNCKPEEVSSVVWYFQKDMGGRRTTVLTDFAGTVVVDSGHIRTGSDVLKRFSIRMFSLIVFRAQVRDSGHYLCGTESGDFFYGYDVDVQPTERMAVAFVDRGQRARGDYSERRFSLFTGFWDWSSCDRCGVRGEQRRVGLCYVRSSGLHPRYRSAVPGVTSCGSGAVPARLRRRARLRGPEVAVRSCLSPCPKEEAPEEGVQAISNVISKLGERPWLPRVPTQFHRQPRGSHLTIACPGARPEHAVGWDKGSTRLYRSRYLVGVNSSMRVFIDHGNHLHIRRLRGSDRGTYFCWREGALVAGFQLRVTARQRRRRALGDPDTIYAIKAIGTSYVVICIIFVVVHISRCSRRLCRSPAGT
ncbi:Ig-like V-type domain-containing protein FAM187A [Colius striatus]|uniref:Ig-like V-type domain-containing protein FAM187A n=1 Tax=Colius striatus TaxID=57412 RepID=UPI002B1E6B6F|nr:Ig-like V-type domain-containing protein FAM187A [Colius striatus]XP_061873477.1 Ig-like V-type domain-containing protein FAM187A [Colius striatus]